MSTIFVYCIAYTVYEGSEMCKELGTTSLRVRTRARYASLVLVQQRVFPTEACQEFFCFLHAQGEDQLLIECRALPKRYISDLTGCSALVGKCDQSTVSRRLGGAPLDTTDPLTMKGFM